MKVLLGYQYLNHKVISSQEDGFKQLADYNGAESPRTYPSSLRLTDSIFWSLIESSKLQHPHNFDQQMDYLTKELSKLPNAQIVGFEMTLREKVVQLWDYNIKSLYQIMYGKYISTDLFIYFRFWIVSNGQEFFDSALTHTDELAPKIEINEDGESLLYVADEAYMIKNGDNPELMPPRDQALEVDYDFGLYKMSGTYVAPKNFKKKFPKLSKKF